MVAVVFSTTLCFCVVWFTMISRIAWQALTKLNRGIDCAVLDAQPTETFARAIHFTGWNRPFNVLTMLALKPIRALTRIRWI
jgi:hypothetical protein